MGAEEALAAADAVDKALDAGEEPASGLAGVPLALKDVFTTTDAPTTCGSKILEGWTAPYDATVTAKLRAAGRSAVEYGLAGAELEAGDSGLRTFVTVQGSLAMSAIYKWGSEEQKQEWLPRMAAGEGLK